MLSGFVYGINKESHININKLYYVSAFRKSHAVQDKIALDKIALFFNT